MAVTSEYSRYLVLFVFDRSPKLSLCNATGISNEDVSELQNELRRMAANLVGEVSCVLICLHLLL